MVSALITGGAGFIGSYLARKLLSEGNRVIVVDDLSTGLAENLRGIEGNPNFSFHRDTVLNRDLMRKLIDQCDIVFHLAAAVGVKYVVENPVKAIHLNVTSAETVFEEADRLKTKVVLASSSEVYGKNENERFSEDDDRILGPTTSVRWSYACAKALGEFLALAYWRERKLPVVIIRFFNTCGPGQLGDYGMVIPRFVKAALRGDPLTIHGDGMQRRCFSYVGDIVDAVVKLANHPEAVGEIFNLGSTEEITIEALARKIKEMTGSSSPIVYVPYEKAYARGYEDMRRRVPDISKAHKLIGFRPTVGMDGLLQKVIEHLRAEGVD